MAYSRAIYWVLPIFMKSNLYFPRSLTADVDLVIKAAVAILNLKGNRQGEVLLFENQEIQICCKANNHLTILNCADCQVILEVNSNHLIAFSYVPMVFWSMYYILKNSKF